MWARVLDRTGLPPFGCAHSAGLPWKLLPFHMGPPQAAGVPAVFSSFPPISPNVSSCPVGRPSGSRLPGHATHLRFFFTTTPLRMGALKPGRGGWLLRPPDGVCVCGTSAGTGCRRADIWVAGGITLPRPTLVAALGAGKALGNIPQPFSGLWELWTNLHSRCHTQALTPRYRHFLHRPFITRTIPLQAHARRAILVYRQFVFWRRLFVVSGHILIHLYHNTPHYHPTTYHTAHFYTQKGTRTHTHTRTRNTPFCLTSGLLSQPFLFAHSYTTAYAWAFPAAGL